MDKIDKAQYNNLRDSFQYLVDNVLGEHYYNCCHDVYTSDRECVTAIIKRVDTLTDKVTLYKIISIISTCIAVTSLMVIAVI